MRKAIAVKHCENETSARDLASRATLEGSDTAVYYDTHFGVWAVAYYGPAPIDTGDANARDGHGHQCSEREEGM